MKFSLLVYLLLAFSISAFAQGDRLEQIGIQQCYSKGWNYKSHQAGNGGTMTVLCEKQDGTKETITGVSTGVSDDTKVVVKPAPDNPNDSGATPQAPVLDKPIKKPTIIATQEEQDEDEDDDTPDYKQTGGSVTTTSKTTINEDGANPTINTKNKELDNRKWKDKSKHTTNNYFTFNGQKSTVKKNSDGSVIVVDTSGAVLGTISQNVCGAKCTNIDAACFACCGQAAANNSIIFADSAKLPMDAVKYTRSGKPRCLDPKTGRYSKSNCKNSSLYKQSITLSSGTRDGAIVSTGGIIAGGSSSACISGCTTECGTSACLGKNRYSNVVNRNSSGAGAHDCVDCSSRSGTSLIYNERKDNSWLGPAIFGVAGMVGNVWSTSIRSRADERIANGWQNAYVTGQELCHGAYQNTYQGYLDQNAASQGEYQGYLDYLSGQQQSYYDNIYNNELPDTGANFIDPGAPTPPSLTAPTRTECNGFGIGSFAGYGGYNGNGFGGIGNPYLGAGYSQGYLGFMQGPYGGLPGPGIGTGVGVNIGINGGLGGFGGGVGGFPGLGGGIYGNGGFGGVGGGIYGPGTPGYTGGGGIYGNGGFGGLGGYNGGGINPGGMYGGQWGGSAGLGLNNPYGTGMGGYWNGSGGWQQQGWQQSRQTNPQAYAQDSMLAQQALAIQAQQANQNLYQGSFGGVPYSQGNLGFSLQGGYGTQGGFYGSPVSPYGNGYQYGYR